MTALESGQRHRLLVVDDEENNRDIVQRYLRGEHEVVGVENGAKALEWLETQPVDLVLLDVIMPEMDGLETCRRMKAITGRPFLPVLLLTALNGQEDRNEGLAAGADDFLTKPLDRRELRLRVRTFLRLRDQERTIRAQIADLQHLQELKDDLVALIVHDLRNPLTGMQGYLELLKQQTLAPQYSALAPRVESLMVSTRKLREITDGMLDVRLLEEQRLQLHAEPTRIRSVLEDAVATVAGAGLAKNVPLRVTLDGEPAATLDRRLVIRAVENLLSNAIRHTGPGTTVDIRASNGPNDVAIEIADRGEGVADEFKNVLFQKFGSIEAPKRGGRHRGYGLGLYLVRLVAEAHGGRVSVADREGGGATFRLTLPS